jgi:glycosyltransferase involved in cell wall biosynthesis
MRFCMVTTFYPPYHMGGDAVYVQSLARSLQRLGHAVEVVHCEDAYHAAGGSAPSAGPIDNDCVVVHRLRHPLGLLSPLITQQTGMPGLKRRALESLLARDFDVIHFHNISLIGGPGVLSLGRAGAKLYTLHDHWMICPTHVLWKNRKRACDDRTCWTCSVRSGIPPQLWRLGDFARRQLDQIDVLLAPSQFVADKHRETGISRPIEVLPLFSRLDPGPLPARDLRARPQFVFVGRITASKGIAALVEMFAGLAGYDLAIAGVGDLKAALQTRFAHKANIRFVGSLDASGLSALYAGATATIVPSLAPESLGLVALESFAHGTPVLTFATGGCGDAVRAAGAGVVCKDMTELRAAIEGIVRDPVMAAEFGRRARNVFENKYTERRHTAEYLDRVGAVIASKRNGSDRRCGQC